MRDGETRRSPASPRRVRIRRRRGGASQSPPRRRVERETRRGSIPPNARVFDPPGDRTLSIFSGVPRRRRRRRARDGGWRRERDTRARRRRRRAAMSPSTATQSPARRRDPRIFLSRSARSTRSTRSARSTSSTRRMQTRSVDTRRRPRRMRVSPTFARSSRSRRGVYATYRTRTRRVRRRVSIPQPRANPTRRRRGDHREASLAGTRIAFERVSRALASPRVSSRRDLSSRSYVECRPRHPGTDRPVRHRGRRATSRFSSRHRVARSRPQIVIRRPGTRVDTRVV